VLRLDLKKANNRKEGRKRSEFHRHLLRTINRGRRFLFLTLSSVDDLRPTS
jgi:hypothetical protein